MSKKSDLIYLASPYSHPDSSVREQRFRKTNAIAANIMSRGIHVFSPISHTHPIAEAGNLPKEWDYWEHYCKRMLQACDVMWVIKLDGWEKSIGIKAEIKTAKELEMQIEYINPGYRIDA